MLTANRFGVLALCLLTPSVSAQCLEWDGVFAPVGIMGEVRALAVYDAGAGDVLYAGISNYSPFLRQWDGEEWSEVDDAPNSGVVALAVYDDGSGAKLYAGGNFVSAGGSGANRIASWNGSSWAALGTGLQGSGVPQVNALAVFDADGGGPGPAVLIAGGIFDTAGGVLAPNIARWDGANWSSLGAGVNGPVWALNVHDDGSGPALYVGGSFTSAGGVAAFRVARWDGANWSSLGSGAGNGTNGTVIALTDHDDGSGRALYAAGFFTAAGGLPAGHLARWSGSAWSGYGPGFNSNQVNCLGTFDDGSGEALYAGGEFTTAGTTVVGHIAKLSGPGGPALAGGTDDVVNALLVHDFGSGTRLHVAGDFTTADGVLVNRVASWDGAAWAALPSGAGLDSDVAALAVFDAGDGTALYAGGDFSQAGDLSAAGIARWDGDGWSALGSGIGGIGDPEPDVLVLRPHDDGTGPALYAGGVFTTAGGVGVNGIARWNGLAWSDVGGGVTGPAPSGVVALAEFDDGSGTALYAGGRFTHAGGVPAVAIARWDGAAWSDVGGGMGGPDPLVLALAVYDDGSGPALYAAGDFASAGGTPAARIARWNGSSWTPLGTGLNDEVAALCVWNDGAGAALFVGGAFTAAGGLSANRIARWNGAWSLLGGSPANGLGDDVATLAVFHDGVGFALYAGGDFTFAGGFPAPHIAKWNGTGWGPLLNGTDGTVRALAVFDDGEDGSADLYVGGEFDTAGFQPSSFLGKWHGCGSSHQPVCLGDGTRRACPCANDGAAGRGCDNSAATGGAVLAATGAASLSGDTLLLSSSGELPIANSIFLQGDSAITPVGFGDGLRCIGGTLKRLYLHAATGGTATAPQGGDAPISVRSASLGDPIPPGSVRYYQTYYRDPDLAFCPAPAGNTWNVSSGLAVVWAP